MHKVTQILLALIWLSLPMLGLAQNADPAQRGAPIAEFLDSHGRLLMPEGYSGSLDPTGYRMLTEAGQAPKFVAEATPTPAGDSGQWAAFGGLRNGCNGAILAIALMPNGNFAVGGQFSLCAEVLANNIAIYSPSSNTWSSLGTGSGNGLNSGVNALAVSGNDLYVGGFFTFAGGLPANYVARWNGSVWSSLGTGSANGVNGPVRALAVSGGDLYVGGIFMQAGGQPANRVARWNGSGWSTLGSGIGLWVDFSEVSAIAVYGSELYVGGFFTFAGGQSANFVARWNGSVWSSLGAGSDNGVNGPVYALVVFGGDLYVGGKFLEAEGLAANNVARWNGSVWSSLGTGSGTISGNGVNFAVDALAVSGSDLYVGGRFSGAGGGGTVGLSANFVARWNGSAWSSLGTGTGMNSDQGYGVAALAVSGSDLYVGGYFTQAGGQPANRVARWNGSVWSSLGRSNGNGVDREVLALAVSGSDLYVGGTFTRAGGVPANRVARWNGSVWSSLGTDSANGVNGDVTALAVSGSDLYVGGIFNQAGGLPVNRLARWNGSVWSSLGTGIGNGTQADFSDVYALAVSGSDLYVGGGFSEAGGVPAINVARWNGRVWSSLGTGIGDGVNFSRVYALAVSGSDLYVGGDFSQAGGLPAKNVARWNGSVWSSLGTGSGDALNGQVYALAVSGNDLYVGGRFTQAGGLPANNVARWKGSAWSTLGSGIGNGVDFSQVSALAVSGSDLYVGGFFSGASGGAGGLPANRVARWNGSAWSTLGTGSDNGMSNGSEVHALAVSASALHLGGRFDSAGGQVSERVAKWTPTRISQFAIAAPRQISACACASSPLISWSTSAASTCSPLGGVGTSWAAAFRDLNQGSSVVAAYNPSTLQCASLPVGSTVTLTLSCASNGEPVLATDTLTVVAATCGSPPTAGAPSATVPTGDGSYQLTAPITSNPGGGTLTAAVVQQPAAGSLVAAIVGSQLVLTYTPAAARVPLAAQTVRVVLGNGDAGTVYTYTINTPPELFEDGFEG